MALYGSGNTTGINSTGLGAQGLNLTVNDHAGRLLISQVADGIYTLPSINTNANGDTAATTTTTTITVVQLSLVTKDTTSN
jgi:hypothetical protein